MGNPAGVRRDFVGLEQRRREAAELLRQGVHQAEVARRVRAHRQSVSRWAQQLEEGGLRGLKRAGRAGRKARLRQEDLRRIERGLKRGLRVLAAGRAVSSVTIYVILNKNHIRHNAMKLKNIIQEATAALKRNWVTSILTILGISVGVGAFICVVAIGNAGSSSIDKQLQNLGDNFIWIEAGSRARNGVRYGARGDRTLILGDATAIVGQVPLVKSMSPNADGHTQVVYAGENWVTMFRGVTPVFLQIRRWNMKLGAFFTEADVDATAPVCVLGQTVVDNLFGNEDPIGKTIRVQ